MTTDELIARLQELRAQHGNLPVYLLLDYWIDDEQSRVVAKSEYRPAQCERKWTSYPERILLEPRL